MLGFFFGLDYVLDLRDEISKVGRKDEFLLRLPETGDRFPLPAPAFSRPAPSCHDQTPSIPAAIDGRPVLAPPSGADAFQYRGATHSRGWSRSAKRARRSFQFLEALEVVAPSVHLHAATVAPHSTWAR
jgi:hypothetical protein